MTEKNIEQKIKEINVFVERIKYKIRKEIMESFESTIRQFLQQQHHYKLFNHRDFEKLQSDFTQTLHSWFTNNDHHLTNIAVEHIEQKFKIDNNYKNSNQESP
jgi:hypothetical protein